MVSAIQEIEMQAYSISYSPFFHEPSYFLDEDSLFRFNQNRELLDCIDPETPFEAALGETYKAELILCESEYSEAKTMSTEISMTNSIPIVYRKLDFMLENVKKQAKKVVHKRKTIEQIRALQDELSGIDSLDKARLGEVAEKTGLTSGQVYKLSLIHICRCRRYAVCRSRWSPYH
eukprot:TRINITY_DN8968_c0_g1_i2.p1 TRINITY_DN8968_c0_g1~~TRINITY_DN8968_c0_g1_i2.p1  ORF type:complete len:176 (-),score=31.07 TRINITY_DN8968_c0_g1_i2:12-539(-)